MLAEPKGLSGLRMCGHCDYGYEGFSNTQEDKFIF